VESLNAFAEQALGEREHAEVVAHLAECGRCRQVVFLAQEAAGEMVSAVAFDAGDRGTEVRRAWFRSWWLVWAPTAALAAVVGLAVYVHVRRVEMAAEMAKLTTEAAPPQMGARNPETPAPPAMAAVPKVAPVAPREPNEGAKKAEAPRLAGSGLAAPGLAAGALTAGAMKANSDAEAAQEEEKGAVEEGKQAPEATQRSAMASRAVAQAAASEAVQSAPAVGALAAPAAQSEASPAPLPNLPVGARHGVGGAFAVYKTRPVELPSGLPTVSAVTVRDRRLAVDRVGGVFLSEDSGSHWESVEKQWNGRAVTVRLQAAGAQDGATPAAVLEIVNDQGQVWTSTDGKTWTAQSR
jgi:hypothetical protein